MEGDPCMASFRTHASFGIAAGLICAIGSFSLAFVPDSLSLPLGIGVAVLVGALLPDMDSDTGLPFHLTFGSLSLVAMFFTSVYVARLVPGDYVRIIGFGLGVGLVMWMLVGWLFKRFTVHRGMAHSIPAAALSAFISYSVIIRFGLPAWDAFLLGGSVGFGYLLHLVLDEFHAAINFHGTPFVPNKALGSALKWRSQSAWTTTCVYAALVFFVLLDIQDMVQFSARLLSFT